MRNWKKVDVTANACCLITLAKTKLCTLVCQCGQAWATQNEEFVKVKDGTYPCMTCGALMPDSVFECVDCDKRIAR